MATNLRGVMAALLTPFDQQQALDKASLRRLVQFNIQQGIDGLYVGWFDRRSLCTKPFRARTGTGNRR